MKTLKERAKKVESELKDTLIENYTFKGLSVRFEKRFNIVEVSFRGQLSEDVKIQESIDFNINPKFTGKDTKFNVISMGEKNEGTVLIAIMPDGILRWRSSVDRLKGTYCTGNLVYFI